MIRSLFVETSPLLVSFSRCNGNSCCKVSSDTLSVTPYRIVEVPFLPFQVTSRGSTLYLPILTLIVTAPYRPSESVSMTWDTYLYHSSKYDRRMTHTSFQMTQTYFLIVITRRFVRCDIPCSHQAAQSSWKDISSFFFPMTSPPWSCTSRIFILRIRGFETPSHAGVSWSGHHRHCAQGYPIFSYFYRFAERDLLSEFPRRLRNSFISVSKLFLLFPTGVSRSHFLFLFSSYYASPLWPHCS